MQTASYRVGIIGAGTSGVFLADLLSKQGHHVEIFEKAPQPRTDGCGILLVCSGMKALQAGNPEVCQKLQTLGSIARKFEFRNLRGGVANEYVNEYDEGEVPAMLIHRKAILETLLEAIPSEICHTQRELTAITQTENQAIAHFADGTTWEGDLIVGSDGIYSKVRQYVAPDAHINYLGDLVWRGIVPDDDFCTNGDFFVYMRGRGIYANFFDIGNGFTHWGFFTEKDQDPTEIGASRPQDVSIPDQELRKLPDDAYNIIAGTPPEDIVTNYSYDIDPLPQLYHGRVVLIGDAAHAKSPTRARGMTSGFEDALALSHHIQSTEDIPTALQEFQAERLPIVHEYQRSSREISQKTGRGSTRTGSQTNSATSSAAV